MRTRTLSLAAMLLGCTVHVIAQNDTTYLNTGYLQLKKEFTQTITIKGSDLERMPFANLSEALSPWLMGAYTQPGAIQYVVDGNPVVDVNSYSIHDIEEVVLVENAAALGATAGNQRQLVLIKTRRGTGAYGIKATAQTGLVNTGGSDNRPWHDYYASGWLNLTKFSAGVSGNWQRDVYPLGNTSEREVTPFNIGRWRLNSYLDWRPDDNNHIEYTLNFASGELAYLFDSLKVPAPLPIDSSGSGHQQLVTMGLRWQGDWLKGLHNEFMTTYLLSKYSALDYATHAVPNDTTAEMYYQDQSLHRSHHLWVRDQLSYKIGSDDDDWHLEPSLNVSFEHLEEFAGNLENPAFVNLYPPGSPPPTNITGGAAWEDNTPSDIFFLTPSLEMSFRDVVDLKTGLQWAPSQWIYAPADHYLPFASLTLDLARMVNPNGDSRLQLFGSYAQRAVESIHDYSLLDVSNGLFVDPATPGRALNPPFPFYLGAVYTGPPANYRPVIDSLFTYSQPVTPTPAPQYWAWSTGIRYTGWGGRLQAQYYFERRNYSTSGILFTSATDSVPVFPQWISTLHHADIRATLLEGPGLRWMSSLNLTLLRSSVQPIPGLRLEPGKPVVGDIAPNPYSWTGGWVNRLQVGDITAGLDLLYYRNSFILPNIYAGHIWHLPKDQTLEFFLESRGPIRSDPSGLFDQRRYYTIGGKFYL
jgi:hypothetical protein